MITEFDYMGYATDAAAQAAYVNKRIDNSHRYWRLYCVSVILTHCPRVCEYRWMVNDTAVILVRYTTSGTITDSAGSAVSNQAFDGITNTSDVGWIMSADSYIACDFGTPILPTSFGAYTSYGGVTPERGAHMHIDYSDDNITWTTCKNWEFSNGGTGWHIVSTDLAWDWNPDLALLATATASSQSSAVFAASKAIDGNYSGGLSEVHEWASNAEETPWITITWNIPQIISCVILHDRPNLYDNFLTSHLEFSDGSANVDVGELPQDGTGKQINFTPRTVTWIKFKIDSANTAYHATVRSNGLWEFRAYQYQFPTPTSQYETITFDGDYTIHTFTRPPGEFVTIDGDYTIHTFTKNGTFTPTKDGVAQVLLVAGGGASYAYVNGYGGGGAGGLIYNATYPLYAGVPIPVIIGEGGRGMLTAGDDSYFGAMRAYGGGCSNPEQNYIFRNGGSGGGAGHMNPAGLGGLATQTGNYGGIGYGNPGGASIYSGAYPDGSGGGAGGAGVTGGAGGIGAAFNISGVMTYYAGGGGSTSISSVVYDGGMGGGGKNGDGTANTGGGAGGAVSTTPLGGSGIAIIRYLSTSQDEFTQSFTPTKTGNVEVLVVAGGGGGGMDMGGGGGGGGVVYNASYAVTANVPIPITVGQGGRGAPAGGCGGNNSQVHQWVIPAKNGGNSIFGSITALGGGFGGSSVWTYTPGWVGNAGGSGGGASGYNSTAGSGKGLGTVGQGYDGGNAGGSHYSGGGGGAGSAGISGTAVPHGGRGVLNNILGTSYYWAGGGGGAAYTTSPGGNGGIGGGGGGAVGTTLGGAGYNNGKLGGGGAAGAQTNRPGGDGGESTGGGGGGGSHYNFNNNGGNGGSGIVIVKYKTSDFLSNPYGLQSYTEAIIKTEGSYSLKGSALTGLSENKTLIKVFTTPKDLTNIRKLYFDMRSNRTGSNIKVNLHNQSLGLVGGNVVTDGKSNIHVFTVPGIYTISPNATFTAEVTMWGGGGGGGTPGGWTYGAAGGAGGSSFGTMEFVAGQLYTIVVAGGGRINASSAQWAYGGGGRAGEDTDLRYGSGGGGYSGIFSSSVVSQITARLIAGGGGGGGSSRSGWGNTGGAGGGSSGQGGVSPYDGKTAYAGNPGTQVAAGADSSCDGARTAGAQAALLGGNARCYNYGGAGGGGYFGGSAGGYSEVNTMAGGAGGSGYYNPAYVSNAVLTSGNYLIPGDATNPLRGNAGDAGEPNANGKYGRIVIKYTLASHDMDTEATGGIISRDGLFSVHTFVNQEQPGESIAYKEITFSAPVANGETITTVGPYTVHTFTTVGSHTFTPRYACFAEVLIVAGGGGGGGSAAVWAGAATYYGGGGGAGGMIVNPVVPLQSQPYTIVVGGGGGPGGNGNPSSAFGLTAVGGGYGGTGFATIGGVGGSGGGTAGWGGFGNGGPVPAAGTPGQGNSGGYSSSANYTTDNGAGGGGGAGTAGIDIGGGTNRNSAGYGGDGLANNYRTGVDEWYAEGGVGSAWYPGQTTHLIGGSTYGGPSSDGAANTGSGGGGGRFGGVVGSGGSGIVVVRYLTAATGTYIIHTFTKSGSFTPIKPGFAEVLVVAGGGGASTGGGGAGGVCYNSAYPLIAATYSVVVGEGGIGAQPAATTTLRTNGGNSSFDTLVAIGGGAGGENDVANGAQVGGSGGGGGVNSTTNTNGAAGTAGQGNAGGSVSITYRATPYPTAGGGGAGAVGTGPINATTAGNGGIGVAYSTSGSTTYYGGGGGGGCSVTGNYGAGGLGGGGYGGPISGNDGIPGTGGGGGAGGSADLVRAGKGGNGGSGVVIIKYAAEDLLVGDIFQSFTPHKDGSVEALIVGGGGGGGGRYGGGGGGGGVVHLNSAPVYAGVPIRITVGKGGMGARTDSIGSNGYDSVFNTMVAKGGGGGGAYVNGTVPAGQQGGCGGGAGYGISLGGISNQTQPVAPYIGTAYGYAGGSNASASDESSGGGGAGAVGGNASAGVSGGVGGAGYLSAIINTSIPYYWAGGGGGSSYTQIGGNGGIGGGGGGGMSGTAAAGIISYGGAGINPGENGVREDNGACNGGNGGASTGGGGGGAGQQAGITYNSIGGNGGSGIVVVRYLTESQTDAITITPEITDADTWQTIEWDISDIPNIHKNNIDKLIFTVVNDDEDNTFYIDNFYIDEVDNISGSVLDIKTNTILKSSQYNVVRTNLILEQTIRDDETYAPVPSAITVNSIAVATQISDLRTASSKLVRYAASDTFTWTSSPTIIRSLHLKEIAQVVDDANNNARCYASCSSDCGRSCSDVLCRSNCSTACSAVCEGSYCAIGCSTECYNSCDGLCGNSCTGDCFGGCMTGCLAACLGTCLGGQGGSVLDCGDYTCNTSCTGGCLSTCKGVCTGGCIGAARSTTCVAGYCSSLCGGVCTTTCGDYCTGTCGFSCSAVCGASNCASSCSVACASYCGYTCSGNACRVNCAGNCSKNCYDSCMAGCGASCDDTARAGTDPGDGTTTAVLPTGGTVVTSGGYTVHTFNSAGPVTFTPNKAGYIEILLVGGGGGGVSGGGGAGGVVYEPYYLVARTPYTVVAGLGGRGGISSSATLGAEGENSIFGSLVAYGGGRGAMNDTGYLVLDRGAYAGGSGGGGGTTSTVDATGAPGVTGQGYAGGSVTTTKANPYPSAGGGGASHAGYPPASATASGAGGAGVTSSITGAAVVYAGGGGGGVWNGAGGTSGAGGNGGGGAGNGTAGTDGRGGGGGGHSVYTSSGGKGGNGVVIIRYLTSSQLGSFCGTKID